MDHVTVDERTGERAVSDNGRMEGWTATGDIVLMRTIRTRRDGVGAARGEEGTRKGDENRAAGCMLHNRLRFHQRPRARGQSRCTGDRSESCII